MIRRRGYSVLLHLLAPAIVGFSLWRMWRTPAYRDRWQERLGLIPRLTGACPPIWIHAVSVGEVMAAIPLVRALQQRSVSTPIVVTTATPTGAARVAEVFGPQVHHLYQPYDYPFAVHRFIDRIRPRLAVVMETEIWPNLYYGCARAGIPLVIANARISPGSLRGYRRFAALVKESLESVTMVAAQGKAEAESWRALGVPARRLAVTGNLKFDMPVPTGARHAGRQLRRQWGEERAVLIAASTHDGEDQLVLAAHRRLCGELQRPLLVLVPRHPERFDTVAELCRRQRWRVARRSLSEPVTPAVEVYLGDTMGELMSLYAAADAAFVGGSLVPVGGHNLLEPAALGMPVITGPHTFNFNEIRNSLEATGGAAVVSDASELADVAARLLSDERARLTAGEAARAVVEANRGALNRLMEILAPYLEAHETIDAPVPGG